MNYDVISVKVLLSLNLGYYIERAKSMEYQNQKRFEGLRCKDKKQIGISYRKACILLQR
jgi:hypothetical protein